MVTAESPWDDAQRDLAEAAWLAEHSLICPQCGSPREECSTASADEQTAYVHRSVCRYAAAVQRAWRGLHAKDDPKGDVPDAMRPKPSDGHQLYALPVDLAPDDSDWL